MLLPIVAFSLLKPLVESVMRSICVTGRSVETYLWHFNGRVCVSGGGEAEGLSVWG